MSDEAASSCVLPLADLTVIEVAESVAGAFCGRMLAAFGARVIKVERSPRGSWTRYAEPQLPDCDVPESGALFLYDNMGKESILLDWHSADGMTALLDLAANADVLIDDWQPLTRQSLGIDAAALQARNPLLVSLSLTPFGLTGPYADWQSTPLVSLALGGYLYLSGEETREPLMLPGYQAAAVDRAQRLRRLDARSARARHHWQGTARRSVRDGGVGRAAPVHICLTRV